MSARAEELAVQFETVNNELIGLVEGCSDADWKNLCQGENWSVGVTVHHVGSNHRMLVGFAEMMVNGQELPPITMEMIDQGNAQHAIEHANCTRQEVLDLLRIDGQHAASTVRALSDAQLDRTRPMAFAGGAEWPTQQFIEAVLIGHPSQHVTSVKQALGR